MVVVISFILIIFFLIILFFPLKFKFIVNFKLNLNNQKFYFNIDYYFYNLSINKKINQKLKKINLQKHINEIITKYNKNASLVDTKNKKLFKKLKILSYSLKISLFKPKLKLIYNLTYNLEDAGETAILYGILNNLNSCFYTLSHDYVKMDYYKFKINPLFNNEDLIDFKLNSIFYINLAKVIYILLLFKIKNRKYNKKFHISLSQ